MASYQLRCSMVVRLPAKEVFEVFENPYNLIKITPPWLDFRVTSPDKVVMRKGASISYKFKMLGIPLSWTTLIASYDPPVQFIDEQSSGPYTRWHHLHTFEETAEGIAVRDVVDYTLPFGALGKLAQPIVKHQLMQIFSFRQQALAEMWGGAKITHPVILAID